METIQRNPCDYKGHTHTPPRGEARSTKVGAKVWVRAQKTKEWRHEEDRTGQECVRLQWKGTKCTGTTDDNPPHYKKPGRPETWFESRLCMYKLRAGQCARKRRKEMRWQGMKQGKTWKKRREKKCVKGKGWKGKPNGGDRNRWSQTSLQRPRKTCLVWMYTLYAHPRSRQVPMNPKTCFDWLTFSLGPKVQSPKAQRAEHIFVDLLYISFLSNVSSKSS